MQGDEKELGSTEPYPEENDEKCEPQNGEHGGASAQDENGSEDVKLAPAAKAGVLTKQESQEHEKAERFDLGKWLRRVLRESSAYLWRAFRLLLLGIFVGILAGFAGVLFHFAVDGATELRTEFPYIIVLLPILGLLVVFLYRRLGLEGDRGTNGVFDSIRCGNPVPVRLSAGIFIGTVLTHLGGGSSGREGAALQLGASLASGVGRMLRLDGNDSRTLKLCGMCAVFSALFGTPLTAVIFCIEVISPGLIYTWALLPCMAASLSAYGLAQLCGIAPFSFAIGSAAPFTLPTVGLVALLALLCALLGIVMCLTMHGAEKLYRLLFRNAYLRIAVGGAAVVLLSTLLGTDYNGAGMNVVFRALNGEAEYYDFAAKLLLTALTLGAGFKGGEIVPTMFIGATFGCVAAPLLGLDPGFGAALGLCCLFCAVTNSPLASIMLSVEVFGSGSIMYFALAAAVAYVVSGNFSLYSAQHPFYNKLKPIVENQEIL